jgi:hypothetical protein
MDLVQDTHSNNDPKSSSSSSPVLLPSILTGTTNKRVQIVSKAILLTQEIQLDYMAQTVCDIIPIVKPASSSSPIPELVYFIHKLTVRSHVDPRVAVVALIYLHRCKRVFPKGAVGNPGMY